MALVAVGGYGRRELLLGSDLDVVLLHDGRPDISALADRIWYPVWDSGTRLDHAVRTPEEAREAWPAPTCGWRWGCCTARHVAGDAGLTTELRLGVLADWRATAGTRLAELQAMHHERTGRSGELAFLLEPDLKEARGGLRDADAISAIAAAWVAPGPGPRVRAAHGLLLDARHALHEVTGRAMDRLVLQEQDEVARLLELADADALLRRLAGAGRTIAYSLDQSFRQAQRSRAGRSRRLAGCASALPGVKLTRHRPPQVSPLRRPLAEGLVEQDGEVVLARSADPAADPVLVLRAAAAAAQGESGAAAPHPGPAGRLPAAAGSLARRGARRPGRAARRRSSRRSPSGRPLTRKNSSPACCPTGSGCATARSATRCTPSPWTGIWSRPPPTPPH